jgi:AbrB family looped-hinge helix DNA binding protein
MTGKVGPKGQVVIPKEIRDRLGLHPGDEVLFVPEPGGVRVEPARRLADLAGAYAGEGLAVELEDEHRRELEREHALRR